MPSAAVDACCLIDVLATGRVEDILRAADLDWHMPTAVEVEVQHVRQYDPAQPGQVVKVPVDLSSLKTSVVLKVCAPENQLEQDRYVHYATRFRSDGEAMCLAIAEQRGWVIATDDRKVIRVAKQAGVTVVSCPELVRKWADEIQPDQATLCKVLQDIHALAQFKPNAAMPEYDWWMDQLGKATP
jgi:hypothetical protein